MRGSEPSDRPHPVLPRGRSAGRRYPLRCVLVGYDRRVVVWPFLAASCLVVACYHPEPMPGGACAPGDQCPDGLGCSHRTCCRVEDGTAPDTGDPDLAPSNGLTIEQIGCTTTEVAPLELELDTETGELRAGPAGSILRAAGTGVIDGIGFWTIDGMGVFTARRFAVPAAATWTAVGSRSLVLFADSIVVDGVLDAGALEAAGGPGGGAGSAGAGTPSPCYGRDGGWKSAIDAGAGGGGGGAETTGGRGADTAADVDGSTGGGAGGSSCSTPSTIPLRGGNGGGAGGAEGGVVQGGPGGGGGGAVALVALVDVTFAGAVTAPGAGGVTDAGGRGGGGGGSGGAILIESLAVTITGAVTANGGGGGAPGNTGMTRSSGERGHVRDATAAAGAAFGGKTGGHGGARSTAPVAGQTDPSGGGGGGGGGAAGRIEIKSVASSATTAVFSPAPTMTTAAVE